MSAQNTRIPWRWVLGQAGLMLAGSLAIVLLRDHVWWSVSYGVAWVLGSVNAFLYVEMLRRHG